MQLLTTAAVALILAGSSVSAMPTAVYTSLPGHPTSQIPGLGPAREFRGFYKLYRSAYGRKIVFRSRSDELQIENGPVMYLQVAPTGLVAGTALFDVGDSTPWSLGNTLNTVGEMMGVTDDGRCAIDTIDSIGDRYIILGNTGNWTVAAKEGDPIPGVPGATYGIILHETHVTNDGKVGMQSLNSGGLPTNSNVIELFDGQVVAREGMTIPLGQAMGQANPMEFFDFQSYYHDATGDNYMYAGDTTGDPNSDFVVVVNGTVRLQENQLISFNPLFGPIATGTLNGIREMHMESNGDWFVRGGNQNGQDWVIKNGAVIAKTSDPIHTGATETWSDLRDTATYMLHVGNNRGDYVIGGRTSNPVNTDGVLVLNNQTVLARLGDAVDVNGDGMPNENAFIAAFRNDRAVLNDDGWLFFVVLMRAGNGADLGEALLKLRAFVPPPECAGDANFDGVADAADLSVLLGNFGGPSSGPLGGDFNADGMCNAADLSVLLGNFGCVP